MADPYSRRALRRHHLERLKTRCVYIFVTHNFDGMGFWKGISTTSIQERSKRAKERVNTMKPCSCHMCGNPRKFYKGNEKRTMRERKAE